MAKPGNPGLTVRKGCRNAAARPPLVALRLEDYWENSAIEGFLPVPAARILRLVRGHFE